MRTITFAAEDRQALAHDRYHHPDPRVQRQMEVLWLKSHGLTHDRIATSADVSRSTVQCYLDEDLEGGLPCLRQGHWHQPQGALDEYQSSLEEFFREHPVRSAKQAQAVIEQRTGVRRGLSQVRHFLMEDSTHPDMVGPVKPIFFGILSDPRPRRGRRRGRGAIPRARSSPLKALLSPGSSSPQGAAGQTATRRYDG